MRLWVAALRAAGGTDAHAAAARELVLTVLLAHALAAAQHEAPPHQARRAPRRTPSPRRTRQPHHGSLSGRRPRG